METKKLMLLGGLRYLLPVIESAHKLGCKVVTIDNVPNNIAHKFSDEFYNISILNKEEMLKTAQKLRIDGIMSFAVDPGVLTAAYVAEKMNLPFQGSYESVCILQNKAKFRNFLEENGFNVPKSRDYSNVDDVYNDIDYFNWPIIVKPVDSAGSKGVTKVDHIDDLREAVELALNESFIKKCIIEEFIEAEGYSSDSDSFIVDGKLQFCSFSDQWFDLKAENPFTPSAYSWPSSMNYENQFALTKELQRLMTLLKMRTGIFNIETRFGKNGQLYIMEVSPRGGGNRLAEMVNLVYNQDIISQSIKASLGMKIGNLTGSTSQGYWAIIILHSSQSGYFKEIFIDKQIKGSYIKQIDMWIAEGDYISSFTGANKAIGTLILNFDNKDKMSRLIGCQNEWLRIILK